METPKAEGRSEQGKPKVETAPAQGAPKVGAEPTQETSTIEPGSVHNELKAETEPTQGKLKIEPGSVHEKLKAETEPTQGKLKIEPGSVQETLIIPLYGRKLCAELFPELYRDESAARICAGLDYDFSELDQQSKSTLWRFGALEAAMRQLDMQWEIDDYLVAHPRAAVVNMGCGLDQTERACDNGTFRIYNVDMPDIIEARKQLSPAGECERNIASDLNDYAWMDEIDGSEGAVFFAAGVFHYFTAAQARALARELERRFPGGRLVFDTVGKLGKRLMRQTFKNFGMENYDECLFVENPAELHDWCDSATVSSRGYMLGYFDMDDPAVTGLHRFLARRCDGVVKMRINRFDFADGQ